MKSVLDLLFNQLLSIITASRIPKLEKNPDLCLDALDGNEVLFEQIISYAHNNIASIFSTYEVIILENRTKLLQIMKDNIGDALLCIILSKKNIIAVLENSNVLEMVHYTDIILIQTLNTSS